MERQGAFLAHSGIVIGVGINGLHLNAAVGILGPLGVAYNEVVDGVCILPAYGAHHTGLGHLGGDVAGQEGALVLGVGDVQHIGHRR